MPRHAIRLLVVLLSLCALPGCLIECAVDENGGALLKMRYRLTTPAQLDQHKKRFESADVKLVDASVDKDRWATFEAKTGDVTKLSTIAQLQNTVFTLTEGEAGTKVLTAKYTNKNPNKLPEEMVAYFGNEVRLSLTVPGEIVKSNGASAEGKTATWKYPLNDFTNMSEATFSVTYKVEGSETGASETPTPVTAAPDPTAQPGDKKD
jgi:hypothetical protein